MRLLKSCKPKRIIGLGFSDPQWLFQRLFKWKSLNVFCFFVIKKVTFKDCWLKVQDLKFDSFGIDNPPNSPILYLFQVAPKSDHLPLLLTLIWTYLLNQHPCWSQHFPSLLLHSVCLSVFMNRRLALTFDLSSAAAATGRSTQQLDRCQTLLSTVESSPPTDKKLFKEKKK